MNTERIWRKSSYSNSESVCVELSVGAAETSVRDTKDREGGTLAFSRDAFGGLLSAAKADELR